MGEIRNKYFSVALLNWRASNFKGGEVLARSFSFAAALVLFTVLILSGCSRSNGHDINMQDNHFY